MFAFSPANSVFVSTSGIVKFVSKAPAETIKAESKKLSGILDADKRTFAVSIPVNSFEGFNGPLQKEHFSEDYLESDKIPKAVFKGKIIEEVNLALPGTYTVRAKGTMNIHGVDKEMIIKSKIISGAGQITVESLFTITLKDFKINIPKIVNQKIAEEIAIDVKMDMGLKK
ncbi:MAG: YceI family protein [Bacteroidia bacterium]